MKFTGTTKSRRKFIDTAFVLENTGVHAYLGQVLNIKDPKVAAAAASILTIEARHASVIGVLKNATPKGISPDGPFDTPFTAAKVLKAVTGTGFIAGSSDSRPKEGVDPGGVGTFFSFDARRSGVALLQG
ncbi:MAG: ferritin-like domain-containing protein [Solirubrobacterales bacterium]|nr:ferritin-like domain-containing protein [Solirubrobacterales bacterium]